MAMLHDARSAKSANMDDPTEMAYETRAIRKAARIDIPLRDFNWLTSRVPNELEELANRLRQLRREDQDSILSRTMRAQILIGFTYLSIKLPTITSNTGDDLT